MARVPIINQPTVQNQPVPLTNQSVNINGDMFGQNVNQAKANVGNSLLFLQRGLEDFKENIDRTKTIELTTELDKYEQQTLYDKDKGYFYQTGKNAMNKSAEVMKAYDNYAAELMKKSGLFGASAIRANEVIESRKKNIYKAVNAHDYQQTLTWQNSVYNDKQNNLINQAFLNRNNPEMLSKNLKDGMTAIDLQANLQHWDSDTINIKKKEFKALFHENVLTSFLSDGNIQAKSYYEAHKTEFSPEKQASLYRAVISNDNNYKARAFADSLINLPVDEAYSKIDKIENIEFQASVRSQYDIQIRERDRVQQQREREKSQTSWTKIEEALQTDPSRAYLAIDLTQSPEDISAQMSYIENIRKYGEIVTDSEIYLNLREQSLTNADYFKTLDLNKYRPYLSQEQYKEFLKRQNEIKSFGHTVISDTDKKINEVFEKINNRPKHKSVMFSEARAMVREFENRHGRKITDSELDTLINSFDFQGEEGKKTYLEIEKGMNEQTGFIKTIYNDFAYFEKVHNRQPDEKEMNKIIYDRANKLIQNKKQSLQERISATYNKPHETKELTYYADTYLKELGTEYGVKFTIVEGGRYNPRVKGYGSKHNENGVSRACDVSMSEHSNLTKERFFERELKNPMVEKIGTSDPYILARFKNNSKIIDEREFDKKYGTNHVHHAHVTLKKSSSNTSQKQVHRIGNYDVTIRD